MTEHAPDAMDEAARQHARQLYHMVMDSLRHAESLASRASEAMEGTPAVFAFAEMRGAIAQFRDTSPTMRAAFLLTLPPSAR
jgi:hypothetical protein